MNGSLQPPRVQSRAAFTLIELLVVMAVLALLAALLFPVLASVREQGHKANCVSNLHQLYFGFALYAENEDRYLPPYDTRVSGADIGPDFQPHPVRDESGKLVDCLWPYTHSQAIWFCPSDNYARTDSTLGEVRHQFLSYSYHRPFLPYYRPAPQRIDESIIRTAFPARTFEPSDLPMLSDSAQFDFGYSAHTPFYSHRGQFNTLYSDGHVKSSHFGAALR